MLIHTDFLFTVSSPEHTCVSIRQMCSDRDRQRDRETDRETGEDTTDLERVILTSAVYQRLVKKFITVALRTLGENHVVSTPVERKGEGVRVRSGACCLH